jgi:hypothetical protein
LDFDFFSQTGAIVAVAALVIFAISVVIRGGGIKER